MKVLCAGDRFITPAALGAAARDAIADGQDNEVEIVEYAADWPDEPFGPVEGVREAAGVPSALAAAVAGCEVLLSHLAPVTASVFEAADSLRVVGITRGGPVNVDLVAATGAGVPVVYLPGRNLGAVAEFTIGLMITLPRSVVPSSATLRAGDWDARYFRFDLTGPELRASTVGLVGLGAVGLRVAQLAQAFGARVVGYDPFADEQILARQGVELLTLDEMLATSDMVSVHARLTDDTRRMFGTEAFEAMKPGSYFVNTARGELVDQAALLAALESGRLAGAALDVFDPEPPVAGDPLLARPDVIATPHLAGASRQVAIESAQRVAHEVAQFLRTGELINCANPDWRGVIA